MDAHASIVRAKWWICIPVALAVLAIVDAAVLAWHPHPARLPEQFSSAYLERYIDDGRDARPVVVLGDSVLWGYRLTAERTAASLLARAVAPVPVMNLSYEGGSSVNSYFMLRDVLARGVRPRLVVLGINSKETNPADSAYDRLQPALARSVEASIGTADARLLATPAPAGVAGVLGRAVERVWPLYRFRVDLREAFFGSDDASLAAKAAVAALTGSAALQAAAHRPTADKFLGTYDLAPLASKNVDAVYLRKLAALLASERIPTVAFLTPTNHRLLADYIDAPEYDAKLRALAAIPRARGIAVADFDRAIPAVDFFDNDHLTACGNERLAALLAPLARRALR